MTHETRRILREDGCLVLLALIAVMLATCARCEELNDNTEWRQE